jgi:hypothetical protein
MAKKASTNGDAKASRKPLYVYSEILREMEDEILAEMERRLFARQADDIGENLAWTKLRLRGTEWRYRNPHSWDED